MTTETLDGFTEKLSAELTQIEMHVQRALYYARVDSPEKDCIIRQVSLSATVSDAISVPVNASLSYSIYQGTDSHIADYLETNVKYYRCYPYDAWMKFSDYTSLRAMLGYSEVSLAPGEYLIHCRPYLKDTIEECTEPIQAGCAVSADQYSCSLRYVPRHRPWCHRGIFSACKYYSYNIGIIFNDLCHLYRDGVPYPEKKCAQA